MKYIYEDWKPQNSVLVTMRHAEKIMNDYAEAGYLITLRQLYYRIVALGLFPEDRRYRQIENTKKWIRDPEGTKNADPNYKWLGYMIGKGRMAGLLDWNIIVDRHRETIKNSHWDSPISILTSTARSFAIDKWEDQPCHVEVMVEKDALASIIEPVCLELDVRFTANKGYSSISHLYEIGQRIREMADIGKDVVILYLGDHDPSGLDMDRDVFERLGLFSGCAIELERLALTMLQIEEYNPPPDPAKMTDSRAPVYVKQYGYKSWELDALEPQVLADLVRNAVAGFRDDDLMDDAEKREEKMRGYLTEVADNYSEI